MIVEKGFSKSGNLQVIEIGGEQYFSTHEVARILGISRGTFYSLRDRLSLEGKRCGRRKYYSQKEVSRAFLGNKPEGK